MSHKDWRPRWLVVVAILLTGLVLVAYTGLTPTESPTAIAAQGATATPTGVPTAVPTVAVQVPATVNRELDIVWAGPDPSTLSRLGDDALPLPAGGWVSTDDAGEALVKFAEQCKIYIFQASGLQKSWCPKSASLSGNVNCLYEGVIAYINQCVPKLMTQTEGAQVLGGDWMAVIHLPENAAETVVLSFVGQARIEPVLDRDAYALGQTGSVPAGYFWFSTPGLTADPIAGLAAREPHPFDEFLPVVEELDLWRWMPRIMRRARLDNIPYPAIPPFECGAPDNWVLYAVQANDTLFSLAAETGTSVEGIRWANCLGDDTLTAGQPLYLPSLPPPATPTPMPTPTRRPTPTPPPPPTEEPPPPPIPAADLIIAKRGPAEPVQARRAYRYAVTITNAGPFAAQEVGVLDSLPAAVMALGVSTTGCANDPDGVPACQLGTIPAGGSMSFTINVTASGALQTITNNARVTSSIQDPNISNNQASVDTQIISYANLSIKEVDSSDPVATNQVYSYTVTVTNGGPSSAQAVTVTDIVRGGATFKSTIGCANDPDGAPTCELGTIAPNSSRSFTIGVTAPGRQLINIIAPGKEQVITNTVTVTSTTRDPDQKNNHADEPTTVIPPPDLVVAKKDSADPVFVNDVYSYTVAVTNQGPSRAEAVTVTDTLPVSVTFRSTVGCANDPKGVPTCQLGTIPPNSSRSFTINVTAPVTPGTVTNEVAVTSPAGDRKPENDRAEETTEVIPRPLDLAIGKDNGTTRLVRGGSTTYTIVVTNDGLIDAKGALVTDSFPAKQLTDVRWTCAASGGAVCTASSSGDINDRVNIPVGGAATYTVAADVLPCAPGRLVNTASVIPPAGVVDAKPDNNSDTDTDRLTFKPSVMNTLLWIVQGLLAILFTALGALRLSQLFLRGRSQPQAGSAAYAQKSTLSQSKAVSAAYAPSLLWTPLVGLLEILGAVGLVLPGLICVLPRLTSFAAAGLALLSVGTIFTQDRGRERVWVSIVMAIVLLALAYFVAYGRFILIPVHCACAGPPG